ncbi:hypothetical protein P153DRAFT_358229 [Dothidotthia symphoricarpi CBS 119687]|uniref:Heterokaryon incompatibility domain-containing protein n=1 Tax=Dothidotthia symphoricarpi CBS 119687 TaxID=1392245 RepID=A0A6A6AAI7_9PLEO|nr:uncharacterized protein P153DRAFT_358229 [Dothidotthia symphoricarpi CBS 119687]KAF2128104.1 hypothetical protein P153DRAFT_358229 [Dothidotthia symphoricarpi CBS 119687]
MKYDLDETFGVIFKESISALLDQLIDIQRHKVNRDDSERWVQRLRFIDISSVPDLTQSDDGLLVKYSKNTKSTCDREKPLLVLPLREQGEDDGETQYVAVSWKWIKSGEQSPPWGYDVRESFDYRIQRSGQPARKSEFPDHYLERVIMFAQFHEIDKLWIDKECIYQEDDNDRRLGIQIMDEVYGGSTWSLGLLTIPLMHHKDVVILNELLSRSIFENPKDNEAPQYKHGLGTRIMETQMLILQILNDPRWSRGWIFQEDHLASDRMVIFIPHSSHVETEGLSYEFGTLPGNLRIKLSDLRQSVTMFCLANGENESQWPNNEMLSRLKQYNISNKESHKTELDPTITHKMRSWAEGNTYGCKTIQTQTMNCYNESIYPSSTFSIFADIHNRSLQNMEDRISIMANAAKFSTRLDVTPNSPLVKRDYSLSAILLALIVLNGEILRTDIPLNENDIMKYTLQDYLKKVQYKFNAPIPRMSQTYIDHCRFNSPKITHRGIEVKGFLYKLVAYDNPNTPNPLKVTDTDRKLLEPFAKHPNLKPHPGRTLAPLADVVILVLIKNLDEYFGPNSPLSDFLNHNLDLDRTLRRSEKPATSYVLDMMLGIVRALLVGRDLCFARLVGEPDCAPPSAIVIEPLRADGWVGGQSSGDGAGPSYVFTSWDNGWRDHGMQRLASIDVGPFSGGEVDGRDNVLRSYGWVNGVFDFKGGEMGTKKEKNNRGISNSAPSRPLPRERLVCRSVHDTVEQ